MANIDIKYLNKNFSSFKNDLIEYAKAYYPTVYNDFNQASPGSMFIEMASYVGDVLSFYLDNQLQETFLQYAKQKNNLYTMAYMFGYRPKVTSAAIVNLDVYQQVPAKTVGGLQQPDFDYAITVQEGMQVKAPTTNAYFYIPQKVNFTVSSSLDPTEITVYTVDANGVPQSYLLKKTTQAISGQVKTQAFSFGSAQRFTTVTLQDSNIVAITSAADSSGNKWYEVPYLAQDYILETSQNNTSTKNQVPYFITKTTVNRRFVSRFRSDNTLEIEFGPGVNSVADTAIIPNPNTVSVGLTPGSLSQMYTAYDPTNFVTTQTYGLAPQNTTITFSYLVGGGATANVLTNQITNVVSFTATGTNTSYQNTLAVNNAEAASGGGDGDTVEELRLNSLYEFQTQYRAVTQEDYLARTLSMPPQFGKISKAYITKDDVTFANYLAADPSERDPILVSLYVLGLDSNGNLADASTDLKNNLKTYLANFRMLTDSVNIKSAFIINIGVNFDIILRPNYSGQDVIARCILALQNYFNKGNWQINQPIILSDIRALLDAVEGVQTVKKLEIFNKSGVSSGYSKYSYDIPGATLNDVIYPSLDPSIFEVKYLDTDIQGRVVAY
jgi:phage-related baseplate assembly protein